MQARCADQGAARIGVVPTPCSARIADALIDVVIDGTEVSVPGTEVSVLYDLGGCDRLARLSPRIDGIPVIARKLHQDFAPDVGLRRPRRWGTTRSANAPDCRRPYLPRNSRRDGRNLIQARVPGGFSAPLL